MDIVLRRWRPEDAESLSKYADNPKIAAFLREGFAQPFLLENARNFIRNCLEADETQKLFLAVDLGGEAVGSVGIFRKDNVYRKDAELGYWLGEPFWGGGLMTGSIRLASLIAFKKLDIVRISAEPYAHNAASRRVLEKAGFALEGLHRMSVFKDNMLYDSCAYALLRTDIGEEALSMLQNEGPWLGPGGEASCANQPLV